MLIKLGSAVLQQKDILTLTSIVKGGMVAPSTRPTITSSSGSHSLHAQTGLLVCPNASLKYQNNA